MRSQDAMGVGLSGLCLIHCLGLPLIASLAPTMAWMENEAIHVALAVFALLVSLTAMRNWVWGWQGIAIRLLAASGLGLLFYGAFGEFSELGERIVTSVGATGLASAHIASWLVSRRDPHRAG